MKILPFVLTFLRTSMAEADGGGAATAEAEGKKSKTVYVDVVMKDGRTVKFPESTKAKKEILETEGKVTGVRFDFNNGETFTVTLDDIVQWNLLERFALHGVSQKLGDSYASQKDVGDAVEAFISTLNQVKSGKWSEGGEGGGGAGLSILVKALVEATGQTVEAVRATLDTLSQKEKLVLRADPALQPIIQRLEAEKVGGVDRAAVAAKFGLKAA